MKNVLQKPQLADVETHQKYLAWKADNTDVVALIKQSSMKLVAGRRRFSIDAVVNYVRCKEFFEGYRDEPYRINQNHVVSIARDLRMECPEIDEFIQVRVVREKKKKVWKNNKWGIRQ